MRSIREVMAMMPELQRFRDRLNDPEFPTEQEKEEARRVLAAPERQRDLFERLLNP